MRLGLRDRHQPFEDDRGVIRMHARSFEVIDLDTGAVLENQAGMIWGPGSLLMRPLEEGLFTPEHFDAEKDYLVVVVRCDAAIIEEPAPQPRRRARMRKPNKATHWKGSSPAVVSAQARVRMETVERDGRGRFSKAEEVTK